MNAHVPIWFLNRLECTSPEEAIFDRISFLTTFPLSRKAVLESPCIVFFASVEVSTKVTEEVAFLAITRRQPFANELDFLSFHRIRAENFIHYPVVLEVILVLVFASHNLDA